MKKKLIEFAKRRARATISAAKELAATWLWDEKTVDQMESDVEAITGNSNATPPVIGQEEIASQAQSARVNAEGAWKKQLQVLHQCTVQGVGLAKIRFRNDAANFAVVSGLRAGGSSPEEILAEALTWESAWNKTDPTWNPTQTNTLAAFKILRKQCAEDLQTAFTDADSVSREETGKLEQMANALDDTNMAWYAMATKIFPAGTPEGDMIRSSIPTTYVPPAPKTPTPTPPVPAGTQPA